MNFNFEKTEETVSLTEILFNMALQIYNSTFFDFIKFFLAVYVLVLLADIILLFAMKGVGSDIRKGLRGMDMPIVSKSRMEKKWAKVKARLESNSVSQYKVAVLEADAVVDEMLLKIGYKGNNMSERLEQLGSGQLDYKDDLLEAHQIRNKIVHDENFVVDRELAETTIEVYEKFLRYLEFI